MYVSMYVCLYVHTLIELERFNVSGAFEIRPREDECVAVRKSQLVKLLQCLQVVLVVHQH